MRTSICHYRSHCHPLIWSSQTTEPDQTKREQLALDVGNLGIFEHIKRLSAAARQPGKLLENTNKGVRFLPPTWLLVILRRFGTT